MSKELGKEIVNFIGPEGAGKSHNAKLLAETIGKPHISVGDILRFMQENDKTYLGDECRAMFAESRYLDPEMLLLILTKYFKESNKLSEGFVMDGGLRTIPEAKGFPDVLRNSDKNMPLTVVYLNVPEEVSMYRLTEKRKRSDDTPERVANRLKNFNDKLQERLVIIRQNYKVIEIDATGEPEEVFEKICSQLFNRSK